MEMERQMPLRLASDAVSRRRFEVQCQNPLVSNNLALLLAEPANRFRTLQAGCGAHLDQQQNGKLALIAQALEPIG